MLIVSSSMIRQGVIPLLAGLLLAGVQLAGAADGPTPPPAPPAVSVEQAEVLLRGWVTDSLAGAQTEHAAPPGAVFARVQVQGAAVLLYLDVPAEFLDHLTSEQCEEVIRGQLQRLWSLEGVRAVALYARPIGDEKAEYKPLPSYLPPPPPVPDKPEETSASQVTTAGGLPAYNPGRPQGALSGKTVFLSPGHGWYYNTSPLGRWATQRGNSFGIVEDLSNGEAVLQHLAQYLHNAGANVWPCRERDFNTNMVIIDNTAGAPNFTTTGSWTAGTASGTWYGSNYQFSALSTTETAVATYAPSFPQAGHYSVYVWTPSASNRATDAKVRVKHTGGTTTHVLNMQRDGNTWRFLGIYYFNAGRHAAQGSVEISNQGSDTSKFVIADAVRFGGGMGDYVDGGTTSGKPRWEESGRYFAVFMGQPNVSDSTVSAMPRYADWESESWEDAIYFSWHTNAGGGGGRGTHMYVYASGQPPGVGGTFELFDGIAGGDSLAMRIQDSVINDIRAAWDPDWSRREFGAYFGELNPSNNNEMPACLLEVAFHDNQLDAQAITNPRFRDLVSRAVYQGIVDWWYFDHDGPSATPIPTNTKLPEPPTHLAVRNLGNGSLRVSWQAPPSNTGNNLLGDPATSYLVSISTDGFGFNDGTATTGLSMDFTGLTPGAVYYFRVIATNPGGQSFPTEIGGAMVNDVVGTAPILVVNGFDRLDRGQMLSENVQYITAPALRERPMRMNHYGYIRTYAAALAPTGAAFDFCANEAVRGGQVALGSYAVVIWQSGEESTADHTFDAAEQSQVQAYLAAGGRLFVSGAEIGWDLDFAGNGASFYNNYLRADYTADDAGTYTVTPIVNSIFQGVGPITLDNGATIYDVDFPDVIVPTGGSAAVLSYAGGVGTAGVVFDGAYKLVYLAFPFEAITSASTRSALMAAAIDFLLDDRITGDLDGDGDVDLDDWGRLQRCLSGTAVPQLDSECQNAHLDVDTDVDQDDALIFLACFSGPNIPASPECGG